MRRPCQGTTLIADLGQSGGVYNDGILGAAANTVTLQNGGRITYTGNSIDFTIAGTRNFIIGAGGGAINLTQGSAPLYNTTTLATAGQISGAGKLTKGGNDTLKLAAANAGFTGAVDVQGGTLYLADANALQNATGISLGTSRAGLVDIYITPQSTSPWSNAVYSKAGSLLLDPAISYNLNGGAMTLNQIVLNGGALGFTANKTINPATDLTLGSNTYASSVAVAPIASENSSASQGSQSQGIMQMVKVLHFGGNAQQLGGTLTISGPILDTLGSGSPVMLMKSGHNEVLDLTGATGSTYSGGTLILDGRVDINDASQLGTGAINVGSTFNSDPNQLSGRLHIMDNGTTHTVTFGTSQFFRFAGLNTTIGTLAGQVGAPYIDVDNGVTATIQNIDNTLSNNVNTSAIIAKTGLGTLKLQMASNVTGKWSNNYSLYLGQGTVETDLLPTGGVSTQRPVIFDGGNLTVHPFPDAANAGFLNEASSTGFTQMIIRSGKTGTINIDSGASFIEGTAGSTNTTVWDGTLIINGADLTAVAILGGSGTVAAANSGGTLDIRGGRVEVMSANGGVTTPWDKTTFTVNLNGGELDGTDFQKSLSAETSANRNPLNANVNINPISSAGTPKIGGPNLLTLSGAGNTTWKGLLEKVGSGTLDFDRNNAGATTFTSDATTALKISAGTVVVDGSLAFTAGATSTFDKTIGFRVPVENNSLTDNGNGAGLVVQNTTGPDALLPQTLDATGASRVIKSLTGTGGTQVIGVTLTVGNSAANVTQGLLRLTSDAALVGAKFRTDGDTTFADPIDNANTAATGSVTLSANSTTALLISTESAAKVGDVTLAGVGTGGVLNGTLLARSLTISQPTGSFTENAGSLLNLNGVTAIVNNGTFTYNGGTTNATAINSTTPTGQLVLNANLALNEVRQSVKVQVNSGSVLTLTASGGPTTGGTDANVSRMGSLVLSGAADAWTSKLDVNDNKVIIDNANSAVAAATYTQTNNQLKQGFDNGAWDGQGIVSTKAQTNVNNGVPVTIGVINNDDGSGNPAFFHDGTDLPQFGGQNVNGTAVLTKYTYFGDADLSGTVDAVDYTFFVAGVQSGGTLTGWEWGDFDYSGTIDAVDYTFFVFGVQGQGAALAGGGSGPTSVPEPASLALLGLGGLLMLKRRNRKS